MNTSKWSSIKWGSKDLFSSKGCSKVVKIGTFLAVDRNAIFTGLIFTTKHNKRSHFAVYFSLSLKKIIFKPKKALLQSRKVGNKHFTLINIPLKGKIQTF